MDAWVFDKSPVVKSTVSWTLLAQLYAKEDKPDLAIELFDEMMRSIAEIDCLSLETTIGACGLLKSLQEGRYIHRIAKNCELEVDVLVSNWQLIRMERKFHGYLLRSGIDTNLKVQNALTDMYVKSGLIDKASEIYSRMNKFRLLLFP